MANWQGVIFDLDDTLYPERDYVLSGFRAVASWSAEALGMSESVSLAELTELFEAGARGDTFNRWLTGHGLEPDSWVAAMVEAYRQHEPHVAVFPEVPSLLHALRGRYRLGVLSDGYEVVQERKLTALGIRACFDEVLFTDSLGRDAWKPSPRGFVVLQARLSLSAEEMVYVGDNPRKDFLAARRAGLASIRLRHPVGLHQAVEPAGADDEPDWEVDSWRELGAMLMERS